MYSYVVLLCQLFSRYKKVFGVPTITRLWRLDSSRKMDSSFILQCMKTLFGNDELKGVKNRIQHRENA